MGWPNKLYKINSCTHFFNLFPLPAAPLLPVPWGSFFHFFFLYIYLWPSSPVSFLLCISQVSSKDSLPMFNHHFFKAHALDIYTKKQKSTNYHHSLCRLYDFHFHIVIYVLKPLRFFSTQVCFLLGSLVEQKNVIIQGTAIQVESGDKHKRFLLRAKRVEKIKVESQAEEANTKNQPKTHKWSDGGLWEFPASCLWLHLQIVH